MHSPDSAEFRRFWTEDRIDRSFVANAHRMMIGLRVAHDWSRIFGSLVVAGGRGKFLQIRHSQEMSVDVPDELAARLQEIGNSGDSSLSKTIQAKQDLADFQAGLVERLSQYAGKYVDRILAVTVTDRGFWSSDFDGAILYQSACDPDRLAEIAGLSVIDALPARDLAASGTGNFLDSLPLWFMFADRQLRGATSNSLALLLDRDPHWFLLPGSDGLDDLLPAIVSGRIFEDTQVRRLSNRLVAMVKACERPDAELPIGTAHVITDGPGPGVDSKNLIAPLEHAGIAVEFFKPTSELTPTETIAARSTALLGLLFTDQLPTNIPDMTGATGLRLLGRLTPGKPFSWRNLLAVMADSQSTPMRLRDAI